ncbi:glutaredoxin family protein [Peribacillus frigoritolerans]|uniref:glutaredoxin family protein n=1 Tax=Peribacillus frigoritolerans TaxID=450367 RepID=UPI00105A796A|nr:glutaredoxin family protein [Peribacillus frigoritolerans]TDL83239.1 glutaredoxin family protein [Peribacillus frigoritolerans]
MPQQKKILLWSRKGCHYCEEIKEFFERNEYEYTAIDVEGKDYLRDILELKYGIRHVPVVEIGSNHIFQGVIEKDFMLIESLIAGRNVTVG